MMRALAASYIAGGTACSFGLVPLVGFSVAPGPNEISSVSVTVSDTKSVIKCGFALPCRHMEVELGVQIYPGDCPGTNVHLISVCFQQVVQEHGQTSQQCRCGSFGDEWPPPTSACN